MTTWTSNDLDRIAQADELRIQPLRADGTPRGPVPVWVVRDGADLYVRSYRGSEGAWFRAARRSHLGRIQAGTTAADVTFVEEGDPGVNDRVDQAYRAKYGRRGAGYVSAMLAPGARSTTLKLIPR
jgi:hypothetical protein